jgi:hypothetical protein
MILLDVKFPNIPSRGFPCLSSASPSDFLIDIVQNITIAVLQKSIHLPSSSLLFHLLPKVKCPQLKECRYVAYIAQRLKFLKLCHDLEKYNNVFVQERNVYIAS